MTGLTNYNLLRGAIVSKGLTFERFAELLGIGRKTLSMKSSGKSEFNQSEILKAKQILGLSDDQLMSIFFADYVPE